MLDTLHEESNNCNLSLRISQVQTDNDAQKSGLKDGQLNNTSETTSFAQLDDSHENLNNSLEHATSHSSEHLNNSIEQINVPVGLSDTQTRTRSFSGDQLNNTLDTVNKNTQDSQFKRSNENTGVSDEYHVTDNSNTSISSTQHTTVGSDRMDQSGLEITELPMLLNNASKFKHNIPVLNEFYAKETKTLNTNMLINDEDDSQDLNFDSHKFAKVENDTPARTNEINVHQEAVAMDVDKNDYYKSFKNVNIEADKCSKVSIKELFAMNREEKCCNATSVSKASFDPNFSKPSFDPDFDNVKRMKMESTEKNWQYQELSKLNRVSKIETSVDIKSYKDKDPEEAGSPSSTSGSDSRTVEEGETSSILGLAESVNAQQLEEEEDDEEEEEEDDDDDLLEAAENAWDSYIKKHNSVIVSTFQGMFKSTVCIPSNFITKV